MSTLLLTQSDVRAVLTMDIALGAVEEAFAAHGRGDALMPPKVYLPLEHHDGDFRAMPAYLGRAAGVKWVNSHPENPSRHGLPAVMGLYILSDPSTAVPLAVMDGTLLTAVRTGAAAGVASKHLARPNPKTLGFIGCGVQARWILAAHRLVYGDSVEVQCADVSRSAAEGFAQEARGSAVSLEEAAACDIVCSATPSRRPLIRRSWVKSGAHLNAMGADAPGKQELDPQILADALVFVDDLKQATESGEVNVPIRDERYSPASIRGTLGEIVARRTDGRKREEAISVFDSTGLAIQDVAIARVIYDAACEQGIGTKINFAD